MRAGHVQGGGSAGAGSEPSERTMCLVVLECASQERQQIEDSRQREGMRVVSPGSRDPGTMDVLRVLISAVAAMAVLSEKNRCGLRGEASQRPDWIELDDR